MPTIHSVKADLKAPTVIDTSNHLGNLSKYPYGYSPMTVTLAVSEEFIFCAHDKRIDAGRNDSDGL